MANNSSSLIKKGTEGGYAVDKVGDYLVNNGYLSSYSGSYNDDFQSALAKAKVDLLGGSNYKGATFGNATLRAIDNANAKKAEEQKQAWENEVLASYQNLEAQYQQIAAAQQQSYQQEAQEAMRRTQATVDEINARKPEIESSFKDAQKQNYINSALQRNQMGDYLSAMGYSGGMAESTLLKLNNNYENNRIAAASERDKALQEIDRLASEAKISGDSDLSAVASNYYQNYVNTLKDQAQMNYQVTLDKQEQSNIDRDYLLNLRQIQGSEKEASQQQDKEMAAQDFETFINTYENKWQKKATYEQWIKNLQAMDDPYGYNKQKIQYLRQYINSKFTSAGTSSTESTKNSPLTNTDVSVDGLSDNAASIQRQALLAIGATGAYQPLSGDSRFSQMTSGKSGAAGIIERAVTDRTITQIEGKLIAKNLGLI